MVFPTGIEPVAPSLGNLCSILLSYGNESRNDDILTNINMHFVVGHRIAGCIGNIQFIHGKPHLGHGTQDFFGVTAGFCAFNSDLGGISLGWMKGHKFKTGVRVFMKCLVQGNIDRLFVINICFVKKDFNQGARICHGGRLRRIRSF